MIIPMAEIKAIYYELKGEKGHWFSKETMQFFGSRLPRYGYKSKKDEKKIYFITSEDAFNKGTRRYSIRCFDSTTGDIDTVDEFLRYSSEEQAKATLKRLL